MKQFAFTLAILVLLISNLIAQVQPLKKVTPSALQPVFINCGDTIELSNGWVVVIPTNNCTESSVQQRLNAGETPKYIYDSGIPLDSLYGKTYQGGLIFFLHTPSGAGLVAAPTDQSTAIPWWCWWCSSFIATGATGHAIGTGQSNTTAIIAAQGTGPNAAKLCDDLTIGIYSDWFLPSRNELNQMWLNLADSDGNGNNSGPADPGNLGGFARAFYWSSTEHDCCVAWFQAFDNGVQSNSTKDNDGRVRAARAF